MYPVRSALSALALAACALPALARAAPPSVPSTSSFGERIDVRVVNVEAVVTDRAGNRVRGLNPADFRILVDGKETPIGYFAEVADGQALAPAAPAAPASATGGATPASAAASPVGAGAVGISYLVFVDDSFSLAAQRNVVLDRLVADLPRLGPEDRMAIVAYDGRKLAALANWNGDHAALAAALAQAKNLPTRGQQALTERAAILRERAFNQEVAEDAVKVFQGRGPAPGQPSSQPQNTLRQGEVLNAGTAPARRSRPGHCVEDFPISNIQCIELEEAVSAAAAVLSGMPVPGGRKVMLLLSGGWPYGAAPHFFRPLVETANELGYTLYPVDVPGIDPGTGVVDAAANGPASGFVNGRWERESKEALETLAVATGGKALVNSARLEALPRAVADTRSYYWLGFSPVWRADDRGHDVKVTVRRPGLAVRARNGFTDLSPRTADRMRTASLLLLGGAAEDRKLHLEAGEPKPAGLGEIELPLIVTVPFDALTLSTTEKGYLAEAMLSFAVQDDSGGSASLPGVALRLNLPRAPVPGSFGRYRTRVKLRKSGQRLVVMLRDVTSGATLWDERKIDF
jgi:VWFA-related protein